MPKFSIFTPTNNAKQLKRLEKSLSAQTIQDFEWVIVPNGDVTPDGLRALLTIPQLRVVPYTGETTNIGELKNFACKHSQGEILVEVDHDDELTPNCLEELAKAFDDETIDFAYSNFCEIKPDGTPNVYDKDRGWRYRPYNWKGTIQQECVSFSPDPTSFCKIWYGPNHVRAWRKIFYDKIGGHDVTMRVLDDQDLFSRTYIRGKVHHINKCLYIYHVHGENNSASKELNGFIQTETLNIHDKYIYPLVEKWCDLNGLRKIDLCGGISPAEGYESVDLEEGSINANLDDKWPFEDGEVGVFRAHDALEHLKNPIHVMKEAYRCLAPRGWFLTLTPSTDGRGAFQDPTHISFWNSNSFWYYTSRDTAKYIRYNDLFHLSRVKNFFPGNFQKEHNIIYVKADMYKPDATVPGFLREKKA